MPLAGLALAECRQTLVLAGLSLRGRQDLSGFIAAFSGGDRHVADYLVAEVLQRQPEKLRAFLLRTSVLERLSGPLCDAVLETRGSTERLRELEASNLFVVPLDDRRQWYRYHQLFADFLRLQLGAREPGLVPVLHRRAAAAERSTSSKISVARARAAPNAWELMPSGGGPR